MENKEILLQMEGIEKQFPGVKVLKGIDFSVRRGEVHALMGENGAGKSTLIKILTGVYPLDGGRILIDGKEAGIRSKRDAAENGIAVIYQELSVIPTLTVAENIFLGQELTKGRAFLSKKEMVRRAGELIRQCQFDIRPDDLVEDLSIARRQMVEILKALLCRARLLIMDEPTASLNQQESETLFGIIQRLKGQGTSIIYISHRLEEVYAMSDRLTVLRDGEVVGVLDKSEIEPEKVVRMMVGRNLSNEGHVLHEAMPGAPVLRVENLSSETLLDGITFEAYGGQILGIGGLVGSGRSEVLRSIFALDPITSGNITLDGKPLGRRTKDVIRSGVGFVPEDRRLEGFVPLLSINRNIALANYDLLCRGAYVPSRKELALAQDTIGSLSIRPADPGAKCMNLSGGNQQKVVLGKWLRRGLRVLLVDEPTVGIDIGAKEEIYSILRAIASQGGIIVMVSSDLEELLKVSDRILILAGGRVFADLRNEGLTADDILLAESGIRRGDEA